MIVRSLLLSSAVAAVLGCPALALPSDPRTGLAPGLHDAGRAAYGLKLVHSTPPPPGFSDPEAMFAQAAPSSGDAARPSAARYSPLALANSDLAFSGDRLFMGSFHGLNAYDLSGADGPELILSLVCPGGQGDVSVHGDLLFMSVEQNRARLDCGASGAEGDVNAERFRGVRIFDISDLSSPRQVAAVQTCRGSHTHTQVPDPRDPNVLYIYNSATAAVRKTDELNICSEGEPEANPETALYSIDVIKVSLDAPERAAVVSRPRIFADRDTGRIASLWRGGAAGVATQQTAQTNHCHDVTAYPEIGLAAGACSGNGILLDISDPENPSRVSEMFDPDMAYWHSATFSNAGDKIVFTDEWGGGTSARCRSEDPDNWGADLIATIENGELKGRSFYKLPAAQGTTENCVAHNGNLLPVPGRDLMVQAWYQGGVSILDFTDPANPFEVAYFDRGPLDSDRLIVGGAWSAYWYNGKIFVSEIARGLDVLELAPSEHLSPAEIAAAESVRLEALNPQTQVRATWRDSPDVAQSYVDQLSRTAGPHAEATAMAGREVERWRTGQVPSPNVVETLRSAAAAASGADRARLGALAELFQRRSAPG